MSQINKKDILAIKNWLSGFDNYQQDIDNLLICKFLHACYNDLERTKKCIEKFCTNRLNMPEVFTDRDPLSAKIQTAFSITNAGAFRAGDKEFLIYSLDDPTLEKYNFYDILKAFTIQSDYHLITSDFIAERQYYLLDMKCVSLRIIPKINVFYLRRFISHLLETMPVRLNQIHLFNCPSYIDKLYSLVKPCLPQNIREIVNFHHNVETLHSAVGKKYLPIEMGGDAGSLKEVHLHLVQQIQSDRTIFQDNKIWMAELKKKNNNRKPKRQISNNI